MKIVDNVFSDYDRAKEMKEFDETKAGVKGLVDSGVVKIPRFFIHPPEKLPSPLSNNIASDHISQLVPMIDLKGFGSEQRSEIVNRNGNGSGSSWVFPYPDLTCGPRPVARTRPVY